MAVGPDRAGEPQSERPPAACGTELALGATPSHYRVGFGVGRDRAWSSWGRTLVVRGRILRAVHEFCSWEQGRSPLLAQRHGSGRTADPFLSHKHIFVWFEDVISRFPKTQSFLFQSSGPWG